MFQDQPSFSERLKRNNNLTKKIIIYIYANSKIALSVTSLLKNAVEWYYIFNRFSFRYSMATITSLDFERDTLKLFCRCNPTIMIPKIHSQLQSKLFRKLPINLGKIKNMQVFIQMLQILFMIFKNACMVFNFIV